MIQVHLPVRSSRDQIPNMHFPISQEKVVELVSRMELTAQVMQRCIEEEIIELVNLSDEWHQNALEEFLTAKKLSQDDLSVWLDKRGWRSADLDIHLAKPEALFRFAKQRFGPGLEERYLASASDLDNVIYSLLRVKDALLARELWLRLCEGEISFVNAAAKYGEGPEAKRKGLIGPIPIGSIQPPKIRKSLRELSPGEFTSPKQLGEWNLLLRLEQLSPSSFDETMQRKLLLDQLQSFLSERAQALLEDQPVDELHYDAES